MSQTVNVPLPLRRDDKCPFDPSAEIKELRETSPVSWTDSPFSQMDPPLRFFTRYEDVRQILGSDSVSNTRPELAEMPGNLLALDGEKHATLRRKLTGSFTVKKVKELAPRIEALVKERLDLMEQNGRPADLVRDFALPIPSLVICELLGVPVADQPYFQSFSTMLLDITIPREEKDQPIAEFEDYLLGLVNQHRSTPNSSILGRLVVDHHETMSDAEFVGVARILLIAGHETTSNMLSLGTLLLLRNPDQLAVLKGSPDSVNGAVEEMLRYLSIVSATAPRMAINDFEVNGTQIKAGDRLLCSLMSANRDPRFMEEADDFDIRRDIGTHVTFGYGIHQCLGQQLARLEMRIAFPALFARFPDLALQYPEQEVDYRSNAFIYGLKSLPVTW